MEKSVLNELVEGILSIMEDRIVRIVLYGSVARGTNTEDKLSDFVVDMNLKHDKVFSVIDIDYDNFRKWERVTPFYENVNKEGIVLWTAA